MNDEWMKNVEAELRRVRAAPLPGELRKRLKHEPGEEPLTIGDRVLATFSGMGAVAACVVVAITVLQFTGPSDRSAGAVDYAAREQLATEYHDLLAAR